MWHMNTEKFCQSIGKIKIMKIKGKLMNWKIHLSEVTLTPKDYCLV